MITLKNVTRAVPKSLAIEVEGALRGRFYCRVPVTHAPEEVSSAAYFGDEQARMRLREGDIIEVEPEDLSWTGELTVRALLPQSREVLTRWRFGPVLHDEGIPDVSPDELFSIAWKGPQLRWCVFAGEERRETGLESKEKAFRRMSELRGDKAVA